MTGVMTASAPDAARPDHARAFGAAPAALLLLSADLVVIDASEEWLASTGTTRTDVVGRYLADALGRHPENPAADGVAALRASVLRARDGRRPETSSALRYDVALPDVSRAERWWNHRTVPVLDDGGDVVLLVHRADDVTEAVRGAAEQRRTADALAGLATTVSALADAQNRADLLRQLFRHGRPALRADLLAVALLEPGGTQLAVLDTRDAAGGEPRRMPARSPVAMAVAASGRPVFEADATQGGRTDPPFAGLRAWAALPLRAGRRPLGSVLVGWEGAREFLEDEVRVLGAFASQCSQAVDRVARLETERRQASRPAAWPRRCSAHCSASHRSSRSSTSRFGTARPRARPRWAGTGTTPSSPATARRRSWSATSPATTGPRPASPGSCAACSAGSRSPCPARTSGRCSVHWTAP
jgi:hypothetical protein